MTNREKLRKSMYYIYNMDFLPLDSDEYESMFRGLAEYLNIRIDDIAWEDFTHNINSLKASDKKWFTEIFDKYF